MLADEVVADAQAEVMPDEFHADVQANVLADVNP